VTYRKDLQDEGTRPREGWMWQRLRLDSGSCEFLREALGSLDVYHYPDEGQILTTTDAPASLLVGIYEREVEEAKTFGL